MPAFKSTTQAFDIFSNYRDSYDQQDGEDQTKCYWSKDVTLQAEEIAFLSPGVVHYHKTCCQVDELVQALPIFAQFLLPPFKRCDG